MVLQEDPFCKNFKAAVCLSLFLTVRFDLDVKPMLQVDVGNSLISPY
jgi:hypothetical protein